MDEKFHEEQHWHQPTANSEETLEENFDWVQKFCGHT